ncbi:ABC-2 transporter permease [Salicibibacter cibi]|uniref:ABC-2 transporter permease n=1 Tax=Salicibibacter cibi TaxID=2743001 RepID=A0A7T6Z9D0_9BACI|nr:ABC-2 transporter permease [Salicibibacter cibi]QQK79284.1 ABC-2 transporter permease [Salicibibacter cibi]
MKGLLLNQYYSVGKSLWNYLLLSVVITAILLFSQNEMMMAFATFLPILFMVTPALEVLKHESMSGWNKFVLTLPIKRSQVVQSHYLFYFMVMLIGLLVTIVLFILAELIAGQVLTDQSIYSMMNGVGIAFILGFIAYPLTYQLGTEKSDMVLMFGVIAAIGLYLLSGWLFETILSNMSPDTLQGMNIDLLFSSGFLAVTLVFFIVSFLITLQVYKKKEF